MMLNEVVEQIQHCFSHLRMKEKLNQHHLTFMFNTVFKRRAVRYGTKLENSITELGVLFSDLALQVSSNLLLCDSLGM